MAKKKQQTPFSLPNYIKTKARTLPIYKCYINSNWMGLAFTTIIIAREHKSGNVTTGLFIVDMYSRGLFTSRVLFNHTKEHLKEIRDSIVPIDSETDMVVEIAYSLAHNIIYGGIAHAEKKGFKPDREFEVLKYFLEENDGSIEFIDIKFGTNELLKSIEMFYGKDKFDKLY